MHRDFKGIWIDKIIWLNKSLTITEKCFLAEIDSLDGENHCFALNSHFAAWSGLSESQCSRIISSLKTKGFINIYFKRDGNAVVKKRIIEVVNKTSITDPSNNVKESLSRPYIAASKAHGTAPVKKYADYEDVVRLWKKYDKTDTFVKEYAALSGKYVKAIEDVAEAKLTIEQVEHCLKCYNSDYEKRKSNQADPWRYGSISAFVDKAPGLFLNKKVPPEPKQTEAPKTPKPRHRCHTGLEGAKLTWINGEWECNGCKTVESQWGPYERYETDEKPVVNGEEVFAGMRGMFGEVNSEPQPDMVF